MITRFSSWRQRLDRHFLNERLDGALGYDRIAGFFSSSILEVAGEALEAMPGTVRMVCNSQVDARDVMIAKKAAQAAMRREWCDFQPEKLEGAEAKHRFCRLHEFLRTGKLQVRVLPDAQYGLIHGKAGVITRADGQKISFLGSANESLTAWRLNYELLWEDDDPEAVEWVQQEFDTLWHSTFAVDLAEFIVTDIDRLSRRKVLGSVDQWREQPDPAAPIIESPVYRKEVGLWEHQKYFVKLAFDAHLGPHGARFVLADQVGLGKTLQLAMAAELMALAGSKPVLILAPKPLIWQWQDEMQNLLAMPSAVWTGKQWVDEAGVEYPSSGVESIRRCPRRVGIVSTGLITRGSEIRDRLLSMEFECVILDEAHRARRRNLSPAKVFDVAEPNQLLAFLREISTKTKSMLLATATPVQMHPIEAWDLLDALSRGSDAVLGGHGSLWRKPRPALDLLLGHTASPDDELRLWEWLRNPLPPFLEDAYHLAEEFCRLLSGRAPSGFFRTLLLRRVGSTMEAGRRTVENMLSGWEALDEDEDDEETLSQLRTLTSTERALLERFLKALEANQERDPKYAIVRRQLLDAGWLDLGCIIFSQYFGSVWWLAEQLSAELPGEPIGIYAGSAKSGLIQRGHFTRRARDDLKAAVRTGEIRLLLGTDAASEGLNLQKLGTLINLDLPWNPSRLEQRKGRIQRIGQLRDTVDIFNMRYAGSVEDRVHELLSDRLENIASLFGQLPDVLEDVWIDVALGEIDKAHQTIDMVPREHPFQLRYHRIRPVDWESCATVLGGTDRTRFLARGWQDR